MRVLLQPASGKEAMSHFEDTITGGVLIDSLKDRISPQAFEELQELGEENVKVWGFVPTLKDKPRKEWLDLSKGDLVLFYANKQFYYAAFVHSKIHNPELAKELWGIDGEGRTWEYVYFIKEGKQIQMPYDPTVLGYAEGHIVRGAVLLREDKSDMMKEYMQISEGEILDEDKVEPTIKDKVDFAKRVREPRTAEEAEEEIKSISKDLSRRPVKERVVTAKMLARNPKFSRLVKERVNYECEICGAKPFLQKTRLPYAEAHHIHELAKSRIDSPEYMICVCPTCHKVLHYGDDKALKERKKIESG